ncbi:hypothetical protein EI555_012556, partial [Monodon monoceros]
VPYLTLHSTSPLRRKVIAAMEPKVTCVLVMVFALALSSLAQGEAETCQMEPHQRVNCGHPSITSTECKSNSCCFDSKISGVPWCFYPVAVDEPVEGKPMTTPWGLKMQNS